MRAVLREREELPPGEEAYGGEAVRLRSEKVFAASDCCRRRRPEILRGLNCLAVWHGMKAAL